MLQGSPSGWHAAKIMLFPESAAGKYVDGFPFLSARWREACGPRAPRQNQDWL